MARVRFFLLNSFGGGRRQITQQMLNQIPQQFRSRIQQAQQNGGFAGPRGFGGQESALTTWVTQHCKAVPSSQWQPASTSSGTGGGGGGFGGEARTSYMIAPRHIHECTRVWVLFTTQQQYPYSSHFFTERKLCMIKTQHEIAGYLSKGTTVLKFLRQRQN